MVSCELLRDEFLEPFHARAPGDHQPFQNSTRPLQRPVTLDELYPEGYHERDLALPPDPEYITWRNLFLWLDKLHKFAELWVQAGIHPFRKRALKKCEEWMLERFEGSNGLAAIFPAMLNSLIAMKALGYPDDHPLSNRAGWSAS